MRPLAGTFHLRARSTCGRLGLDESLAARIESLLREAVVYERLRLHCMPGVYGWDGASPPVLLLSVAARDDFQPA